jgi:hypothetical protein
VLCIIIAKSLIPPGYFLDLWKSGWFLLGNWLMTATMAYALYESMLYEQRLHSFIDFIDSNLEATSVMDMTSNFAQAKQAPPTAQDTLGNRVLFTPDLFKIMEASRRKAQMHDGIQPIVMSEPVQ